MELPHAGPAQLVIGNSVEIEGPLGGGEAADGIAVRQPRLFRVGRQRVRPQFHRHLRKRHVAGIGQSLLKRLLAVGTGADNGVVPNLHRALAIPGPGVVVLEFFNGRRPGHGLENGARRECGGKEPVQIRALVPVAVQNI
ncbi:hypothetical protein SDC9_105036 [bioreactor metagenome]|uniref:Uncharacterized protein n=1 Tax=bioreactor metagenome TaxID=1076179 RepID=A0A645AZI7_9ZZZZ